MKTIRFEITEETNTALNAIKGNSLKKPFAQELFEKAVMAEYKKLTKAVIAEYKKLNKKANS